MRSTPTHPGLRHRLSLAALATLALLAAAPAARAWSPHGHQTVAGIADQLIDKTPTGKKVRAILGSNLQTASVWADCARAVVSTTGGGWTYEAVDRLGHTHAECAPFENDASKALLIDFVKRNATRCGGFASAAQCRHTGFHFTDVSVQRKAYDVDAPGASPTDLVHAVQATIAKLKPGAAPAVPGINLKDQKEALRLLAHYLGDLHQPLHVAVDYLDDAGHPLDPATPADAHAHNNGGGNGLAFEGIDLHKAWDNIPGPMAVKLLAGDGALAAKAVPATPGAVATWPEAWATDTLTQAKAAYQGLSFGAKQGKDWPATAKEPDYRKAREALQQQQIVKAGARLAQLLTALFP